jgi:hypothetical protein
MRIQFKNIIEIKDAVARIQLMSFVGGINATQKSGREGPESDLVIDLQVSQRRYRAMVQWIPAYAFFPVLLETHTAADTVFVSAAAPGVLPLMASLQPRPQEASGRTPNAPPLPPKDGFDDLYGDISAIESSFDVEVGMSGAKNCTLIIDGGLLDEGPVGWRMEDSIYPGKPGEILTLRRDGESIVMEIQHA